MTTGAIDEHPRAAGCGLDAQMGRFDYIVCHGVYSWVPSQTQTAILDAYAKPITALQMAAEGLEFEPDLVGFSTTTAVITLYQFLL